MTSPFDSARLIRILQQGDSSEKENAFREIFNHYFERLLHLAQRRLHPRIRQRIGADDIVNSGLKSLFFHFQKGELNWSSEETLWKLLAGAIINKAAAAARRHTADKRDVFHEQHRASANPENSDDPLWDHLAKDPTPDEVGFFQEIIESLSEEVLQQVALGKLQGKTDDELAQELGYSTETIRIKKRRIARLWQRHFA